MPNPTGQWHKTEHCSELQALCSPDLRVGRAVHEERDFFQGFVTCSNEALHHLVIAFCKLARESSVIHAKACTKTDIVSRAQQLVHSAHLNTRADELDASYKNDYLLRHRAIYPPGAACCSLTSCQAVFYISIYMHAPYVHVLYIMMVVSSSRPFLPRNPLPQK